MPRHAQGSDAMVGDKEASNRRPATNMLDLPISLIWEFYMYAPECVVLHTR